MTAVLSPSDALRNPMFGTHDDNNHLDYSSPTVDWRAKYLEVADLLADTRNELDDFHHSSKELEEELERELERAEKAQQDLKNKAARAETEKSEWKAKFMSLQTTHNTTTTSLQRELDILRQESQKTKIKLRDMEMGNDDLERNERAISSSLADMETKYSKALEEKILLEHELLDKAGIEEECQRLRDEVRDANEEIAVLKEQFATMSNTSATASSPAPSSASASSTRKSGENPRSSRVLSPSELGLDPKKPSQPPKPSLEVPEKSRLGYSASIRRTAGFPSASPRPLASSTNIASPSGLARSNTTPALGRSTRNPPLARPALGTNSPTRMPAPAGVAASRSKGVQMVSEMRARVKNLEQKIHTRVPRLRMGNVTTTTNGIATTGSGARPSPTVANFKTPVYHANSRAGSLDIDRAMARTSNPPSLSASRRSSGVGDQSSWVLIMEDSPSPKKDIAALAKSRRRSPSPSARVRYRSQNSSAEAAAVARSTIRPKAMTVQTSAGLTAHRPSASDSNSVSRPTTPTLLPVPSATLFNSTNTISAAPSAFSASAKRASLGQSSNSNLSASGLRPPSASGMYRSISGGSDLNMDDLATSRTSSISSVRSSTSTATTRLPSNEFGKSRIGRPRKSGGESDLLDKSFSAASKSRLRSGSNYGR